MCSLVVDVGLPNLQMTSRRLKEKDMHQVTETADCECKYAWVQERQSKAAMT